MLGWLIVIGVMNLLPHVVLSAARNASMEVVDCTPPVNATGRGVVALCKPQTNARGHSEQPSYSMLMQAFYGLAAITIIVVAYFIFRTMRFV